MLCIQAQVHNFCATETIKCLQELIDFDSLYNSLFSHPVDEVKDQAPGYLLRIVDPQDLGTLSKKTILGDFNSLVQVHLKVFQVIVITMLLSNVDDTIYFLGKLHFQICLIQVKLRSLIMNEWYFENVQFTGLKGFEYGLNFWLQCIVIVNMYVWFVLIK